MMISLTRQNTYREMSTGIAAEGAIIMKQV